MCLHDCKSSIDINNQAGQLISLPMYQSEGVSKSWFDKAEAESVLCCFFETQLPE